jgi:hypothetical protein
MPKNKNSTDPLDMQDGPTFIPMIERLTEQKRVNQPLIPKDLHDLLDYLEGHFGDDEGRFNSTDLWPWRNLTPTRRNLNERILRIILKRLMAPKAQLDKHWKRLHADMGEHRRRRKASGKLVTANVADIVVNAVVDALLPVREVPAKEITSIARNTARAAAELFACLTSLQKTGMSLESLLPTEEAIRHDRDENGDKDYADARFFIHMKLPRSLTNEQREEITEYALRVTVGDPFVALGVLGTIAQKASAYKVKRHNLSGRQRFAYLMAAHMVRDSMSFFGVPRYERAEAFAKAASGVQIKGLRQMMEREKNVPATKGPKKTRAPLRGN